MTLHTCPRGHAQENDSVAGFLLCAPCVGRVEGQLRALPALHQDCLHQASPAVRRTNPTKVMSSRNRDHLNVAVLDTRHRTLTVLESWSGMVTDKLGTAPPPRTVPHLARFLVRHLGWLVTQHPAVDFADEIEGLVVELRQTVDPAPSALHAVIRKCVVDGCAGTISAMPRGGGGTGARHLACSAGHSWEMREWLGLRKLMKRQREGVDG
ncbi:hypothetical protein [Streptomyces sp. NP-1717]|uniref:hypothetical protein n=1 Tax=Streptomyces sp. NP-1717 TaxID=2704470 RepID=UPI001F5E128B|nr:hypothetical protein [Streptomyces sp. NP-1717]MCI3221341.1 hypothetical protein [Streptomyces sp. NP-1717]